MKFTVNAIALYNQISRIAGVVGNNRIVPILENVLFQATESKIVLTTSDLQTTLLASVPCKGSGKAQVAAPAKPLLEILKNLPDQDITLDIEDNQISIKSANGKYTLSGEEWSDFPREWDVKDAQTFTIDAAELSQGLAVTTFATTDDETRMSMMGVLFHKSGGMMKLAATDGHKLTRYQVENDEDIDFNFVVPRKALNELQKIADDNILITAKFNDHHISFNNGIVHLRTRLIDELFPDYENVIPKESDKEALVNRKNVMSALKRIATCSNKESHSVALNFSRGVLELETEDINFNRTAKETIAIEYKGEPLTIGFNGRLLLDILNHLESSEVKIKLGAFNRSALIFPMDDDSTLMLLMPEKIAKPKPVEA